jgi:GNAT superfamily N-acetyltransferase
VTELDWGLSEAFDGPDVDAISAGLRAFNVAVGGIGSSRGLCCTVRTPSRELVGGAVARSWGECAELQMLWVADGWRRRGLGAELLARVEAEVAARGCRQLHLDTFSFQAPGFYAGRGFETVLVIDGFPGGATKHLMRKALARATLIGQGRRAG